MKTADQWLCQIFGELGPTKEGAAEVIRAIQADAIQSHSTRLEHIKVAALSASENLRKMADGLRAVIEIDQPKKQLFYSS